MLEHTSAIFRIVSALSLSVIPVKVSIWIMAIENEGRSQDGAIDIIILVKEELFLEARCNTSCINIKSNFDAISPEMAKQISPPASFRIVATSRGLMYSAGFII